MHLIAYLSVLGCLLVTLVCAGLCLAAAWGGEERVSPWAERGQTAVTILVTLCSSILLYALAARDFSFVYVSEYTDRLLPMFYALTAFWAGQAGSILLWVWMTAFFGFFFMHGRGYQAMPGRTRNLYWLFYMVVQAFFFLILTSYSNPFMQASPPLPEGSGLNPLLQNPGMIFHPPLLLLGYAGFTVPACLALAAWLSGEERLWIPASHNYSRLSWVFLTSGIILGAWWSYMELGWGGYWAWDPVENASLIPWLSGTAFLHTATIETRRGSLRKTNVFLILLTLLLCFFGTYVVRSGVIQSLHAFGGGGVGTQLMVFLLLGLAVTLAAVLGGGARNVKPLSGLESRQGMLVLGAWLFLALGLVVLLATMWPVISALWSDNQVGLDAKFYNRVCLPLFSLIVLLFVFCPWIGWTGGVRDKKGFWIVTAGLFAAAAALYAMGVRQPVALLAASSGAAALLSIVLLMATRPEIRRTRFGMGTYAIHAGLALMAVGIAFSGPYQLSKEAILSPGQSLNIGAYTVVYKDAAQRSTPALTAIAARLEVKKGDRSIGTLMPERRLYRNFEQPFAEVSVLPGLGDELYATLVAVADGNAASFKISVNPLVNWIWIGGTILSLAPFLCMRRPTLPGDRE